MLGAQTLGTFSVSSSDVLEGGWIKSGAARTVAIAHRRMHTSEQLLCVLSHCPGPSLFLLKIFIHSKVRVAPTGQERQKEIWSAERERSSACWFTL